MSRSEGEGSRYSLGIIRGFATLIVLVVGCVYMVHHRSDLEVLAEIRFLELTALGLSILVFFVATGYTLNLLARTLGVALSPVEWIGLTLLANALNYLGPIRPGAMAKAVYLKRKGMAYSRFSSLLVASSLLTVFCSGLAGLVVLGLLGLYRGFDSAWLTAVCGALIVASATPWLVPISRFEHRGRVWEILNRAIHGFDEIRCQRGRAMAVAGSILLQHLVAACSCQLSFRALGFEMDFLTALALGVFAAVSNLVTITPNNIGVQEIVMAYVYSLMGMDFSNGVLGVGLIRAVHIVLAFALAPIVAWKLGDRQRAGNANDE